MAGATSSGKSVSVAGASRRSSAEPVRSCSSAAARCSRWSAKRRLASSRSSSSACRRCSAMAAMGWEGGPGYLDISFQSFPWCIKHEKLAPQCTAESKIQLNPHMT